MPPKLPEADFRKVLSEFERCCLVWSSFQLPSQSVEAFSEIRRDSSLFIHKTLLGIEKYIWENGGYNMLSFIGGSCKLCKNGCPTDKCANPHQARIPIEAIAVKTAENVGVKIVFPPREKLMRVGLIAW